MNRHSRIDLFLALFLTFIALNAVGGGWYGMAGAKGIPLDWLEGSPFRNFFLPSLFLLVVVAGCSGLAAVSILRRWRSAGRIVAVTGIILILWILVQLLIIGYVSWMQPAVCIAGIVILGASVFIQRSAENT